MQQRANGPGGEAGDFAAVQFAVAAQKSLHQQGNVVAPFLERRQFDGKYVEAKKQVFPKTSGANFFAQIDIAGGHHPYIDGDGLDAAHALDDPLLKRPEQFALCDKTQRRNLIEKQRAAVGTLKTSRPRRGGTGVGTTLYAKQLGLDQRVGDGCAIERNERRVPARADFVQRLRKQLLANAGSTGKQHGCLRRRDTRNQMARRAEGR